MTARRDTAILLALITVLASAPGSAVADRVSAGPSGLRGPELVVLGNDTSIELTVATLPVDARVVASAGVLGPPRTDGALTRFSLELPTQRSPRIAIVAVIDRDDTVVDWLALPLAGQANTSVRTAPRADVTVRVGDREHGPVRADSRGVAEVPIVVPPGVSEATSVARTVNGGEREQRVNLGVRPFQRTLAICSAAGDRVVVIATEPDGSPAANAPVVVATGGTLAAIDRTAAGVFVARRTEIDEARVAVRAGFAGEDGVAASCDLQTPPAPPTGLDLAAARTPVVAGSEPVELRITPRFAARARPLEVTAIALDADVGQATAAVRGVDGTWTASWRPAEELRGRRTARIAASATIAGGATVRGELVIELVPAPASTLSARVPGALRADGRTRGWLGLQLSDRFGNPVEATPIEIWRGGERLGAVPSSSAARFSYTAPRSHTAATDALILRVPSTGMATRAVVQLEPLPGPYVVSARAGVITNFGRVTAPMVQLDGGVYLPVLGDRLSAHVIAGAYSTRITAAAVDESIDARLTVVPLLGAIAYHANVASVDVRGGVGAGVALSWSRLSAPSLGTQREQQVTFAGTAFLGGARAAGPGQIVGEVAYLHSTIDGMLAGRVGGMTLTLGYALDL